MMGFHGGRLRFLGSIINVGVGAKTDPIFWALCQRLELPGLGGYMTAFARGLLPRIRAALAGEGLGEVFVSFPEP